ncbi:phage tail tape measure protein, TP901 family [Paenibacillus sp. FSL R7-277]|uniref:phage tail tape measure protein n=1 Tax=unclassified Paenibacillus TaxID=185978 RepID=UPI0003E2B96A|nr:phage tail tape measure protein [Paenibacillus sp. FSL R7-277]ETT78990.1 phage tail tape measure protein, TP901 family [Paenibacillus sp. FSL R7-277]
MAGSGSGNPSSISELIVRLNVLVNPNVPRSVEEVEQQIKDLEDVLKGLARAGYFDQLRGDAEDAGDEAEQLGDKLKAAFEKVDFSMLTKAVEPLKAVWTAVNDSAGAMAQLQASTGLTAAEMSGMKEISDSLYSQNYGKNFEDIGEAVGTVQQVLGQTGDELEKTTQTAMTYRDVFKGDISDSVQAVDAMMQKFGISSEQAYNLMAQGAQKGMNTSGGLLSAVEKYSADFKKMGYSADEMFELLSSGMDNGGNSLEGLAGLVKKFSSTVKEGSDSTKAAVYELFAPEQLNQFSAALVSGGTKSKEFGELVKVAGKNGAVALVKDLKAGGDSASKAMLQLRKTMGNGDEIFKGLADGSMTGKDAMNQLIAKLKAIKDPVHQAALASAIFGSQFEEIGNKAVLSLGQTRHQFDMTRQTMDEVSAIKDNTLTEQFAAIGRELMSGLVVPLGESVMPALQGLTSWASDNKEVLMVIGLAVPAAMLATKTVKIVQGFSTIIKAASAASGAAGGFAGALGLLTNPVGLAVAGVGLVTAGVIAFKKHQEDARQELLNMGDVLGESYANYSAIEEANSKTQNLITEHDRLTGKIKDARTPADELLEARRKLKDVEQTLIDMNPNILSAEGSKNDKFREQMGLVGDIAKAREEMGRRELEHEALTAQAKLPELENNYSELTQNLKDQSAAYEEMKVKYRDYVVLMEEYNEIEYSDLDPNQKGEKFLAFSKKASQVTGKDYTIIDHFEDDYFKMEESINKKNNQLKKTDSDRKEAEDGLVNYYNTQKKIIELDLGGTLQEQAAKYKDMSVAEQDRFRQALDKVMLLNAALDKLPAEMKVNLQLIWEQIGKVPNATGVPGGEGKEGVKPKVKPYHPLYGGPSIAEYAEGGIAYVPSIFGEAGPEIAIPLNRKPRSRSLLEKANDLMGYNNNSVNNGDIHVTWAPSVTLQGGDKSVAEQVREALRQSEDGFERRFKSMLVQQRRVSFQ